MLISVDHTQEPSPQVVSGQNVGKQLSGRNADNMLIYVDHAQEPTPQQVVNGQNLGKLLNGGNVDNMLCKLVMFKNQHHKL